MFVFYPAIWLSPFPSTPFPHPPGMFSKEFFEAYGEVIHAVAMADGEVQHEEVDHMIDVIKKVLEPIEGSSVYGFRSLWFMDGAVVSDSTAAIAKFVAHCQNENIRLNPAQAKALTDCLLEVAKAYGNVEQAEKVVVEQFANAVKGLTA